MGGPAAAAAAAPARAMLLPPAGGGGGPCNFGAEMQPPPSAPSRPQWVLAPAFQRQRASDGGGSAAS
jgi:hypothetical protein